jgi:hypothetical protein
LFSSSRTTLSIVLEGRATSVLVVKAETIGHQLRDVIYMFEKEEQKGKRKSGKIIKKTDPRNIPRTSFMSNGIGM